MKEHQWGEKLVILWAGELWSTDDEAAQHESIARDIWRLYKSGKIKKVSGIAPNWSS